MNDVTQLQWPISAPWFPLSILCSTECAVRIRHARYSTTTSVFKGLAILDVLEDLTRGHYALQFLRMRQSK
jgi:hypothetical protein